MLASDDEIYLAEYAMCGLHSERERKECAEHAVRLNRATRDGAFARERNHVRHHFRRGNSGGKPIELPRNAAELRATCEAEACRVHGCDVAQIGDAEQHQAREFAVIALANVPAHGVPHARDGRLGPTAANRICQYYASRSLSWIGRHMRASSGSEVFQRAVAFGASLVTEWREKRAPRQPNAYAATELGSVA